MKNIFKNVFGGRKRDAGKEPAVAVNANPSPISRVHFPPRLERSGTARLPGWLPVLLTGMLALQVVMLIAPQSLGEWGKSIGHSVVNLTNGVHNAYDSFFTKGTPVQEAIPTVPPTSVALPSVEFLSLPGSVYAGDEVLINAKYDNIDPRNLEFLVVQGNASTLISVSDYQSNSNENTITVKFVANASTQSMTLIAQDKSTNKKITESNPISIQMAARITMDAKPNPDIDPQSNVLFSGLPVDVVIRIEQKTPNEVNWVPIPGATAHVAIKGATTHLTADPQFSFAEGEEANTAGFKADAEGNITFQMTFTEVTASEMVFTLVSPESGISSEYKESVFVPTDLTPGQKFSLSKFDDPAKIVLEDVSSYEWLQIYFYGETDISGARYAKACLLGGWVKGFIWNQPSYPKSDNALSNKGIDNILFGNDAAGMWGKQIFSVDDVGDPAPEFVPVVVIGLIPTE